MLKQPLDVAPGGGVIILASIAIFIWLSISYPRKPCWSIRLKKKAKSIAEGTRKKMARSGIFNKASQGNKGRQ